MSPLNNVQSLSIAGNTAFPATTFRACNSNEPCSAESPVARVVEVCKAVRTYVCWTLLRQCSISTTMKPLLPRKRNPLHVPELLHYVLDHLAESPYSYDDDALVSVMPPGREGERALAALAQTCRMFSEPSLNCLWRKLDSLAPLVRCFTTADNFDETGKVSVS